MPGCQISWYLRLRNDVSCTCREESARAVQPAAPRPGGAQGRALEGRDASGNESAGRSSTASTSSLIDVFVTEMQSVVLLVPPRHCSLLRLGCDPSSAYGTKGHLN